MKQIEILINKYLDGQTSNEEERRLREYFKDKGNEIPEEWKVFQALFAFESMKSETTDLPKIPLDNNTKVTSIRRRNHRMSWIITTAACIVITLVFTFGHLPASKNYAVIEGKKCTDPEVVKQQALEALNDVSADDQETFSALSE